ncbi:uncharacterized protein LOC122756549 [Drosophila santomea]|uniref:uncharacterized protein LOC122756549 n=1 Tax=Drosophila santomea TaxID=129105 RepID=UPI001CCBF7A4|nr:uncharacterized protein LOC122756549 [Drosophila santomea]
MLNGPDFLNPLTEVLMAFRQGQQNSPHIRHAGNDIWNLLRALYCSLCAGAFESITKAHYVDDLIDSYTDDSEAIAVTSKVRDIHAEGGFTIRNWISNSTAILKHFGDWQIAEQHPKERWPGGRFARLKRDVLNGESIPTNREALQVLMSIFDPLGLLSCYTIGLKMLLQKVWRAGIDWDEELPDALLTSWQQWKTVLLQATELEFPRFYSTLLPNADQIDLHTFVDASEYAYAAVTYLRIKRGADVDTVLVAAKCKVAPLKPVSIPRMELLAAVIGVGLAKKAMNVRRLNINSTIDKSSSLIALNVYLDEDGVLRIQGRNDNINPDNAIVLSKNSQIAFLITKYYHEKSHHMMHESTINRIRNDFYVL